MDFMAWSDSYSVGIKRIDQQHQKLIGLINKLFDAMKNRKSKEILGSIIEELTKYTVIHFSTEESYFKQYNFPQAAAHIKEHQEFIAKVGDFKKGFSEGRLMLSTDILEFLQKWLVDHISGSDKQYSSFLVEKGVH